LQAAVRYPNSVRGLAERLNKQGERELLAVMFISGQQLTNSCELT